MTFRIFKQSDFIAMSWKNGGGTTYEIFRYPEQSIEWSWRISLAQVASEGPFSFFPGCQRSLTLLTGNGMRLYFDKNFVDLLPPYATLNFSGDLPISAQLKNGPTSDFNVIWRRDKFNIEVEQLIIDDHIQCPVIPNVSWFIYALSNDGKIEYNNNSYSFTKGDAIWMTPQQDEPPANIKTSGLIFLIKITLLPN